MHRSSSRTGEIAAGYAQTLDLIIPVQEPMFYSGMIYVNEECNEGGTVIMIAQDKKLTPNFGFILKIAMDHVLGQELPRKGQWEVKGCVILHDNDRRN